jgi:hypothetical protein
MKKPTKSSPMPNFNRFTVQGKNAALKFERGFSESGLGREIALAKTKASALCEEMPGRKTRSRRIFLRS